MLAGFLEVIKNAIVKDRDKKTNDLEAMRLAFSRLIESLYEKGIVDKEKIMQNLKTFGIMIDIK
ncbi:25298_t:CDS:2 [Gigaspora rosea]|nr:25298_t:CDS:2 [Gigaspora rosea]